MRKKAGARFPFRYISIIVVMFLVCVLLSGCSSGNKISESIVKNSLTNDLRTFTYADFAESGTDRVLNVDKVTIEGQDEENGGQTVYAEIRMSDDLISAKVYYKLLYRKSSEGWRLDRASEYKNGEMEVRAEPTEAKVRAYYQEKYGDLELIEKRQDQGKYIYRYQYVDKHKYVTIRGTIEATAELGKAGREASWYSEVTETGKDTEWYVEGKWNYYFSSTPETYGKNEWFSDSRYEYTIRKENGQYVYTIDRYTCKPGGTEKYDKSKTGTATINTDKNPEFICYNEFAATSLCFTMDDVRQKGLGVNDPIYPVN